MIKEAVGAYPELHTAMQMHDGCWLLRQARHLVITHSARNRLEATHKANEPKATQSGIRIHVARCSISLGSEEGMGCKHESMK